MMIFGNSCLSSVVVDSLLIVAPIVGFCNCTLYFVLRYSKTCLKRPLKNRQNSYISNKWS